MSYLDLPNRIQTQEERREKYRLCRSLGLNCHWAQRLRDIRPTAIERRIDGLLEGQNLPARPTGVVFTTGVTTPPAGQNGYAPPKISDPFILELEEYALSLEET